MTKNAINSGNSRGQLHYLWHLARRNPLFLLGLTVVALLIVAVLRRLGR